jgi:hypothetical protein
VLPGIGRRQTPRRLALLIATDYTGSATWDHSPSLRELRAQMA